MPAVHYPATVDRSSTNWCVTFPDFPGCIAAGDTVNEAALNAEAALALHLEGMLKDKDPLPEPSDLRIALDVEGFAIGILVRADVPMKVERVLISLDAGLLRSIDAIASNRSAWLADAAREKLQAASVDRQSVMRLLETKLAEPDPLTAKGKAEIVSKRKTSRAR